MVPLAPVSVHLDIYHLDSPSLWSLYSEGAESLDSTGWAPWSGSSASLWGDFRVSIFCPNIMS
jgi:hypothetical protein